MDGASAVVVIAVTPAFNPLLLRALLAPPPLALPKGNRRMQQQQQQQSQQQHGAVRAVVLEVFGCGSAPTRDGRLSEVITEARAQGVVVCVTSQCFTGAVVLDKYAVGAALADAGVVAGGDMTTEAAVTKLAYLVGRHPSDGAAVERGFLADLRGERASGEEEAAFAHNTLVTSPRKPNHLRDAARATGRVASAANAFQAAGSSRAAAREAGVVGKQPQSPPQHQANSRPIVAGLPPPPQRHVGRGNFMGILRRRGTTQSSKEGRASCGGGAGGRGSTSSASRKPHVTGTSLDGVKEGTNGGGDKGGGSSSSYGGALTRMNSTGSVGSEAPQSPTGGGFALKTRRSGKGGRVSKGTTGEQCTREQQLQYEPDGSG